MKAMGWSRIFLGTGLLMCAAAVCAQQVPAPGTDARDVIPEKLPFNTPYGAPISALLAQTALQAAIAEAIKRG